MKRINQTGFSVIEALLIIVAIGIVGFSGWYVYHAKQAADKDYSSTASSTVPTYKTKAGTNKAAVAASSYAGWKTVTFAPENSKLKFPSNVTLDTPTKLVADDTSGSSVGEYESTLASGFSIQMEMLSSPTTNTSFGNLDEATKVGSFVYQGKTYYIVNDQGISLQISTCSNKVCAYTAHSNSKNGVLVFVTYANPSESQHQAPDAIPMDNAYIPTIENVLKSLSY